MNNANFFIKLRDGAQMIVDAANEYLEKREAQTSAWNPSKIKWEQVQGSCGPYERSQDVDNLDFKAMVKDLQSHQGKLARDDFFYWVFANGATVGRKRTKQP